MCHILSLAILLSSVLLYNEPGRISSTSLEMLTLSATAAGLLRAHPRVASHSNHAVTALSRDQSPTLFWVLRDAIFGPGVFPEAYMEQATAHAAPAGHQPEPYGNSIRRIFCRLFPNRHCLTLARPVTEEQQLHVLNEIPTSRLRAPFVTGLRQLGTAIHAAAKPWQSGPVQLTGPLLAELCEAYVEAANEGAVGPYLWQNAMEHLMQQQVAGQDGGNSQLQPSLRDVALPTPGGAGDTAEKVHMVAVATVITVGSLVVLVKTGIISAGVRGISSCVRGIRAAARGLGYWIKDLGSDVLAKLAQEKMAEARRSVTGGHNHQGRANRRASRPPHTEEEDEEAWRGRQVFY